MPSHGHHAHHASHTHHTSHAIHTSHASHPHFGSHASHAHHFEFHHGHLEHHHCEPQPHHAFHKSSHHRHRHIPPENYLDPDCLFGLSVESLNCRAAKCTEYQSLPSALRGYISFVEFKGFCDRIDQLIADTFVPPCLILIPPLCFLMTCISDCTFRDGLLKEIELFNSQLRERGVYWTTVRTNQKYIAQCKVNVYAYQQYCISAGIPILPASSPEGQVMVRTEDGSQSGLMMNVLGPNGQLEMVSVDAGITNARVAPPVPQQVTIVNGQVVLVPLNQDKASTHPSGQVGMAPTADGTTQSPYIQPTQALPQQPMQLASADGYPSVATQLMDPVLLQQQQQPTPSGWLSGSSSGVPRNKVLPGYDEALL